MKQASHAQKSWFIHIRGSYLPRSWEGWLTYLPFFAYLIIVLVYVLRQHHGFWAALLTALPNWVAATVIMTWIASQKS